MIVEYNGWVGFLARWRQRKIQIVGGVVPFWWKVAPVESSSAMKDEVAEVRMRYFNPFLLGRTTLAAEGEVALEIGKYRYR